VHHLCIVETQAFFQSWIKGLVSYQRLEREQHDVTYYLLLAAILNKYLGYTFSDKEATSISSNTRTIPYDSSIQSISWICQSLGCRRPATINENDVQSSFLLETTLLATAVEGYVDDGAIAKDCVASCLANKFGDDGRHIGTSSAMCRKPPSSRMENPCGLHQMDACSARSKLELFVAEIMTSSHHE
jgi:hypothetical protein